VSREVSTEIKSYRDLQVWRVAMDVAEDVYVLTKSFPNSETYGMATQIRRAAVSVAANIAEGHGRETSGAFVNFLRMSQGSLKELETHLLLAVRVGLLDRDDIEPAMQMCDELGRMLRSLIRSIQSKAEREE
jgi:four helix bundle protein